MKESPKTISLLKKISQKQLFFGLIIVLGSLIILYFLTRSYIIAETEENLRHTNYRIEQLLADDQTVHSLLPLFEIKEIKELRTESIRDTLIFDVLQNKNELFRELSIYKTINGKSYNIITRTILVEYDDTLISILITFSVIIVLVYLAQFAFNKNLNKTIWAPFFKNLEVVKAFSIRSEAPIQLEYSDILEFSELNTQIEALTSKLTKDYKNLKQFTEDLSHEVQTPLAIIQAKIENLIDGSQHMDEDHLNTLYDIQKNSKRLAKLNKGLILLTKIDNQQFTSFEPININQLLDSLIEDVHDISVIKNVSIKLSAHQNLSLMMDKVLADVLFSNLIGNALKYSEKGDEIIILMNKNQLTISNSGTQSIANIQNIFERFYKESKHSSSLGLGLAIVKKICDYYNFKIAYHFENQKHLFTIVFED